MSITRRDFLDGIAISTALATLSPATLWAQKGVSANRYYPPILTGMRGSHEGSYEVAHALAWSGQKPAEYESIDEHYDLLVVGGGMSGLAAAWYYRRAQPDARILILDNHDDFGGHAKRNEFHHNGRMVVSLGGAQNLEGAAHYSEAATSLLRDIGIDEAFLQSMTKATPSNFILAGNLEDVVGLALPGKGKDGHITTPGYWSGYAYGAPGYEAAVEKLPIEQAEKEKLKTLFSGERDCLPAMSPEEKIAYCQSTSYNQFLVDKVGLAKQTAEILDCNLRIYNGFTGWNHSVIEALAAGAPGFYATGAAEKLTELLSSTLGDGSIEIHMFPDGNASIARLLVHKLIPKVAPSMNGVEDVVTADFDYSALDREAHNTRIRLNSTVVGVEEKNGKVTIDYVQEGKPLRITGNRTVLACYNGIIPHLCPQLPSKQKEALTYGVKIPFVYANVLLNDGNAFSKLGATLIQCPTDPFQWVSSAPPLAIGGYEPPQDESDPMALFLMAAPTTGPAEGQKATTRDLLRLGRYKVYGTTFDQYEREIRDQLQSLMGKHGFNHETDIKAITVNRLPHGYAYFYLGLDDPDWAEGQAPHEIGRARFGRISIANSDSEATPYMNAAWDAAWRAVNEQLT